MAIISYVSILVYLVSINPAAIAQIGSFALPSPWGWVCEKDLCVKKDTNGVDELDSLNTCKLTCGQFGSLWPKPTQATLSKTVATFLPQSVTHTVSCGTNTQVCQLLEDAFAIFLENINRYHPDYPKSKDGLFKGTYHPETKANSVNVDITVSGADTDLTLNTDESYELTINTAEGATNAVITSTTFFGARHALETLSQLIDYHENEGSLMILTTATISDSPTFKYRGMLLDTSRNFMSVDTIQRTLDGMASTKLNTLHLHLTDSHSFPVDFPSLPKLAYYGAYDSRKVYSPDALRYLQDYARVRGVRLMPEIDAPAHIGNGFQFGPKEGLGELTVCTNQEPWIEYCVEPPCGQFNLANPNIYTVLGQIYTDLVDIFNPMDLYHYGGDEINLNCWNTTQEIINWMNQNNYGLTSDAYYDQWGVFQEKARQLIANASNASGRPEPLGLIWTSHLTEPGRIEQYLDPNKYAIQIWTTKTDASIKRILEQGYKTVFSNHDAWYLDCGFGAWVGEGNNWCTPYKGWQLIYENNPYDIATNLTGKPYTESILGGEVCMWTEQTDDANVDPKLWPRGAALGERLWSNPSTGWYDAEPRFIHHRQRIVARGINAERIQPQWCHQNEGLCYE